LVLGTIIGVGVFNQPASLAPIGPISILALGLTTVGAICLALLFASLTARLQADGGPYAYARAGFGNAVGFVNAWLYWLTTWGGNAAIATGWVLYVERFLNRDHDELTTVGLTLAGLWLATALNLPGVKSLGRVQLWTSVLKFVPLLLISTIGLFFIDPANLAVWNLSGQPTLAAIGAAMALCLFSYLGVESASVAAGQVANPRRNVPLATILGAISAAVVYLLSLVAVFGVVPHDELVASTAPFATAAQQMSGAAWVGSLVALVVIISGFGALNGWSMLSAEMPRAAARDGLFPARFDSVSGRGAPVFGLLISGVLASLLIIGSHIGAQGIEVFNTLILTIGIAGAIPYAFSALAQIKWRLAERRTISTSRLLRDLIVAAVALIFAVLFVVYSRDTEALGFTVYQPFVYLLVVLLLGLPVYLMNRKRMTPPPKPPDSAGSTPVPGSSDAG
jgi:APA family basic amino acid/polyamine antiporter